MTTQTEALKMALEALKLGDTVFYPQTSIAIAAIEGVLAQPEQEPVAWVVYSSAENDIVWADKGKRLKQNTPLYTTPPQRTWVGLTDEEKKEIYNAQSGFPDVCKAIEAKLKEKNT